MAYGQAMLGETVELYKDAVEWGKEQQRLLENCKITQTKQNKCSIKYGQIVHFVVGY